GRYPDGGAGGPADGAGRRRGRIPDAADDGSPRAAHRASRGRGRGRAPRIGRGELHHWDGVRPGRRVHGSVRPAEGWRGGLRNRRESVVRTERFEVETRGGGEMHDLTPRAQAAIAASGCQAGIVTIFVAHTTAAVAISEFEPGLIEDLPATLERLIPAG